MFELWDVYEVDVGVDDYLFSLFVVFFFLFVFLFVCVCFLFVGSVYGVWLFDCDGFCEVVWLIDVEVFCCGECYCEDL